jgi:hypothetical protein
MVLLEALVVAQAEHLRLDALSQYARAGMISLNRWVCVSGGAVCHWLPAPYDKLPSAWSLRALPPPM